MVMRSQKFQSWRVVEMSGVGDLMVESIVGVESRKYEAEHLVEMKVGSILACRYHV